MILKLQTEDTDSFTNSTTLTFLRQFYCAQVPITK